MSDSFDAAAHAAVGEGAPAPVEESAPQAATEETQAEETSPPASEEQTEDAQAGDASGAKSRAAERIQQLLQRDREQRERIAYLEGLNQRAAPEQARQEAPRLSPDLAQWLGEEPKPEAFPAGEFDPQFLRAVAAFEGRKVHAEAVSAQRQAAARQAEDAKARTFIEQAEKAEAEHPDFREVVGRLGHSLPAQVANMVAEAGAEVAYAIAKDADASGRIRAARDVATVAREIGRFEARLEAARNAPKPQPPAAPDPAPRAVRGGNVGVVDPSKMSMSQYAAWSAKQDWGSR